MALWLNLELHTVCMGKRRERKEIVSLNQCFCHSSPVFQHSVPELNSKSSLDSPLEEGRCPKEELYKTDITSLFSLAVKT